MTDNKVAIFSVAALVVAGAAVVIALAVMSVQADDPYPEIPTWPPFTMVYETDGVAYSIGEGSAQTTRETRRLEYRSERDWLDTVTSAPTITTPVGLATRIGSFHKMDGDTYSEFDASTGFSNTETIPDNARKAAGAVILPFPMVEFDVRFSTTPTTATVCFNTKCQENAKGLLYTKPSGVQQVFVDDARGIPLRVGDSLIVREIQINSNQEPVALDN